MNEAIRQSGVVKFNYYFLKLNFHRYLHLHVTVSLSCQISMSVRYRSEIMEFFILLPC